MASDQSDHPNNAVPPRGWEVPPSAEPPDPEPDALAQLLEQLLALVPDELRRA